jgi:hypothetical protein
MLAPRWPDNALDQDGSDHIDFWAFRAWDRGLRRGGPEIHPQPGASAAAALRPLKARRHFAGLQSQPHRAGD